MNKQKAKEIWTDEQTYIKLKERIENSCRYKKECEITPDTCSLFKHRILELLNRF